MTCSDCKYWQENGVQKNQCHRYPPTAGGVVMMNGLQGPQPVVLWGSPETMPDYSCGEWKEKAAVIQ